MIEAIVPGLTILGIGYVAVAALAAVYGAWVIVTECWR
jgi:hypothetical protein